MSHTRNAEVSRTCDKQTSAMNSVVDVKWTITIINRQTIINVADDTAYSYASAPS